MGYDPNEFRNEVFRLLIITLCCIIALYCVITARAETYDPNAVIEEAVAHLGEPYRHNAHGPHRFDCSGFTYYCFKTVYGIELEHSAKGQGYDDAYPKVSLLALKKGDLVYFNTNKHDSDLSDHAGIYIGNGEFIHASSGKDRVVISSLWEGFYNERFSWGRRVLPVMEEEYERFRCE